MMMLIETAVLFACTFAAGIGVFYLAARYEASHQPPPAKAKQKA